MVFVPSGDARMMPPRRQSPRRSGPGGRQDSVGQGATAPGAVPRPDGVPAPRGWPVRFFRGTAVFVVMVASECAPVAQAGGLGQVVFGLSRELELRGHAVEIILPKYDCMHYA